MLGVWLLAACSPSSYSRLTDENDVPELAALKSRYQSLGNHTTRIATSGVSESPIRVALHEIETRQRDKLIVCVHGVFSDCRMWRFLAAELAFDHDVVLVDLPGCGESDKPDPDSLPREAYTPEDMTHRLLEALQVYLRTRSDDPEVTIVAHSYGGALALRMFGDPTLREKFGDVIERIDRLVLLAPLDVAVEKAHPVLIELGRISGVRVWGALQLGLLRERVADGMIENAGAPQLALREEADQKIEILTSWKARRAMQATLNRAVPAKGKRPDWSKIDPIVASYRNVDRPTLILWGVHDEVLPVSMGYKLASQIPGARLVTIPAGMHSFPVEQPTLVAELIRAELSGTPVGRRVDSPVEAKTP